MTIAEVHNFIYFILDKARLGRISHESIDDAFHHAQLSRFTELLPPKSEPGRPPIPVNQIEYGTTVNGMDYLYPFKKMKDFSQDDTPDGLLKFEADYAHLRAIYVLSYNNKHQRTKYAGVPILNENQLSDRLSSQIIFPVPSRPVGIEVYDSGKAVQLYPQQGMAGRYYYFGMPVKTKYAYTVAGRTETQDMENSIDPAWDDESVNAIIWKAIQPLGVNLNAPMDVQWAQYKEKKE